MDVTSTSKVFRRPEASSPSVLPPSPIFKLDSSNADLRGSLSLVKNTATTIVRESKESHLPKE